MERLTIAELIEHCDRQMARIPSGNRFYQEHESVRAYLQILRHYIATDLTPERVAELAQAERDGRLAVIPSPDSSENAVLAAVFRGDDPPAVMHGGGDLDDLLALTHLLVSYTAEVCKIGYDELCLGLSTMEPTTGFTPQKEGPEK